MVMSKRIILIGSQVEEILDKEDEKKDKAELEKIDAELKVTGLPSFHSE